MFHFTGKRISLFLIHIIHCFGAFCNISGQKIRVIYAPGKGENVRKGEATVCINAGLCSNLTRTDRVPVIGRTDAEKCKNPGSYIPAAGIFFDMRL